MMLAKKPADKNRATLDPALLSRIQFGFVIASLPAFTIGLASYIVMLKGLRLAARQPGRRLSTHLDLRDQDLCRGVRVN
jgi:hypothetical protein